MPDVQPLGTFVKAQVLVFFAKNAWSGTLGQFGREQSGDGAYELPELLGAVRPRFRARRSKASPWSTSPRTSAADWPDIKNCLIEANVKDTGQKLAVAPARHPRDVQGGAEVEVPGTQRTVSQFPTLAIHGRAVHHEGRDLARPHLFRPADVQLSRGRLDDRLGHLHRHAECADRAPGRPWRATFS